MGKRIGDAELTEFRNGIFSLRTRRFGTVAELMIQMLYDLDESKTLSFDKRDRRCGARVEIKFSTVIKENDAPIRSDNVIEQCKMANLSNRVMATAEIEKFKFDCNIQQVKCQEFDVLYYGLFFADRIEIFRMNSAEVRSCPGYSDKQHRGNSGEGQFHINESNIAYHRNNFLQRVLTYDELFRLFSAKQHNSKDKTSENI